MEQGVPTLLAYSKGDYPACERLARGLVEEGALATWTAQVWTSALRRQGRFEEAVDLATSLLEPLSSAPWLELLFRVSLGTVTLGEALTRATTEEQRCQAHYHAGAFLIAQGNPKGAEQAWQACRLSSALVAEKTLAEIETLRTIETVPIELRQPMGAALEAMTRRRYVELFGEQQMKSSRGDVEGALELAAQAFEVARRVYVGPHELVASGLGNLGDAHRRVGQRAEAERLLKEAVEAWRATEGDGGASTLLAVQTLAAFYAEEDRFREAEPLLRHVHDVRAATLGPTHSETSHASAALERLREKIRASMPPSLRQSNPMPPRTSKPPSQPPPQPQPQPQPPPQPHPHPHSQPPAHPGPSPRPQPPPPAPTVSTAPPRVTSPPLASTPPSSMPSFPREAQGFRETERFQLARLLGGYTFKSAEAIEAVHLKPDESAVVTFDAKARVIVWDAVNGQPQRTFAIDPTRDDAAAVTAADLSRDGQFALVGRYDGYLQLVDLASASVLWSTLAIVTPQGKRRPKEAPPVLAVSLSPDADVAASLLETEEVVRIWDAREGTRLGDLPGKAPLAFSPDNARIFAGDTLFDARNWNEIATVRGPDGARWRSIAFSNDGGLLLLGGTKGAVTLFDVEEKSARWTVKIEQPTAQHVGFDRDGQPYVVGSSLVSLDAETGQPLKSAAFSATHHVAMARQKNRLFGVARGSRILRQLEIGWGVELDSDGHADLVKAIDFAKGGEHVLTASYDATIRIWHLGTGAQLKSFTFGKFTFAAYFPDGYRVLGVSDLGLRIYDVERGAVEADIKRFGERRVTGVAMSPDGARVLLCTDDGHATMVDVANQQLVWRERLGATLASFSKDGKRVRIVATTGELHTLDAEHGRLVERAPSIGEATKHIFLDDGRRALTVVKGEGLVVRDLKAGTIDTRMGEEGEATELLCATPDERFALTKRADGGVELWEIDQGSVVDRIDLRGSGDRAECASFSADGKTLLIGTARGVVLVFEAKL